MTPNAPPRDAALRREDARDVWWSEPPTCVDDVDRDEASRLRGRWAARTFGSSSLPWAHRLCERQLRRSKLGNGVVRWGTLPPFRKR